MFKSMFYSPKGHHCWEGGPFEKLRHFKIMNVTPNFESFLYLNIFRKKKFVSLSVHYKMAAAKACVKGQDCFYFC